jgi:hypothetical protein
MPYQRKAPRQPRRHTISYQDVCRANHTGTRDLESLWFWHKRLDEVEVYWVAASWSRHDWYQGDIYIPTITGAQLSDLIQGRHIRLTDVLRHEWAHAVADNWPLVMISKRFLTAFGGPYESGEPVMDYDPAHHLTEYAATMPCEDFAENRAGCSVERICQRRNQFPCNRISIVQIRRLLPNPRRQYR